MCLRPKYGTGATRLVFDHELYKNQVIACARKEIAHGSQARDYWTLN